MTTNNNLNTLPYAEWLEKALHDVIAMPVDGICLTVLLKDGEDYTNYYNINMLHKLTIAGLIQQDAMFDAMAANGIIDYEDEEEDEANGEEEE